ncbi:hypothetical protein [Sciscionella sediminilitoris]|uniref:hypothetical protein n=1 Tax=Sciscionella sediminilitoris TaxID=1445613 RepID=UPI0006903C2A|nr:hypothetical protein [Sciscionella sp. SE31]
MADVTVTANSVLVRLSGWEVPLIRRRAVDVPLDAVCTAEAVDDWIAEPMGLRHGGLVVSGLVRIGIWIRARRGERRLVTIRRGTPILRLGCDRSRGADFDELLLSTTAAHSLVDELRVLTGDRR